MTSLVQGTPGNAYLGCVVERYAYDPYGKNTVMKGARSISGDSTTDWELLTTGSAVGNEVLYGGYRHDGETGLYNVRNRPYHPTLGRWTQRDMAGYKDGMDLYQYVAGLPTTYLDPTGRVLVSADITLSQMKAVQTLWYGSGSGTLPPPVIPGIISRFREWSFGFKLYAQAATTFTGGILRFTSPVRSDPYNLNDLENQMQIENTIRNANQSDRYKQEGTPALWTNTRREDGNGYCVECTYVELRFDVEWIDANATALKAMMKKAAELAVGAWDKTGMGSSLVDPLFDYLVDTTQTYRIGLAAMICADGKRSVTAMNAPDTFSSMTEYPSAGGYYTLIWQYLDKASNIGTLTTKTVNGLVTSEVYDP